MYEDAEVELETCWISLILVKIWFHFETLLEVRMEKTRVRALKGDKWEVERELVLKEGKVYILKDEKLRLEVIQLYYNMLVAGYRGK